MFTGYFRDAETGNDYATNRYMTPGNGRFMTPGPSRGASVSPLNPGSWNLYAYVMGDPINFRDRLGLEIAAPRDPTDPTDPCEGCIGGDDPPDTALGPNFTCGDDCEAPPTYTVTGLGCLADNEVPMQGGTTCDVPINPVAQTLFTDVGQMFNVVSVGTFVYGQLTVLPITTTLVYTITDSNTGFALAPSIMATTPGEPAGGIETSSGGNNLIFTAETPSPSNTSIQKLQINTPTGSTPTAPPPGMNVGPELGAGAGPFFQMCGDNGFLFGVFAGGNIGVGFYLNLGCF